MRLKSFPGATLSEAMRAVRAALGENAIIVATREDDAGGVRVTAAIEDFFESPAGIPVPLSSDGSPALETIAEALTRQQVPPSLAEKLMARATQTAADDPVIALAAALESHFSFALPPETKPLLFVGPPGAGKTLCTVKSATKAVLAKKMPAVACTDFDRAGALEQLAAFTRLLKLNVLEIEDPHALAELVLLQKGNPFLIDTAGCNPFAPQEREATRALIAAVGEAALVLPAGLDAGEGIELAQSFRSLGATRLIVTRLDIVRRLGSLLRMVYETRLPLAFFSQSPKVTEPLQVLNAVTLARLILRMEGA